MEQRNQNLDGIARNNFHLRNKENLMNFNNKKSQIYQGYPELSIEEGQILLKKWDENHFTDFNSWLQIARAKAHFHIDERTSYNSCGDRTTKTKNYQCNLELSFNDKNCESLVSNGFGKSKK